MNRKEGERPGPSERVRHLHRRAPPSINIRPLYGDLGRQQLRKIHRHRPVHPRGSNTRSAFAGGKRSHPSAEPHRRLEIAKTSSGSYLSPRLSPALKHPRTTPASASRPATSGGEYYGLPGSQATNRLGLVIGDIAGKGIRRGASHGRSPGQCSAAQSLWPRNEPSSSSQSPSTALSLPEPPPGTRAYATGLLRELRRQQQSRCVTQLRPSLQPSPPQTMVTSRTLHSTATVFPRPLRRLAISHRRSNSLPGADIFTSLITDGASRSLQTRSEEDFGENKRSSGALRQKLPALPPQDILSAHHQ